MSSQVRQTLNCFSADATERLPVLEGFIEGSESRSIRFACLHAQLVTDCEFEVTGSITCNFYRLGEHIQKVDQSSIGLIRAGMSLHFTDKLRNLGQHAVEFGEAIERKMVGSTFRGDVDD